MPEWEYDYHHEKVSPTNQARIKGILNKKGKKGWNLVQAIVGTGQDENQVKIHGFIFKRES